MNSTLLSSESSSGSVSDDRVASLENVANNIFIFFSATLVFLMQAGFAMLEVGTIDHRHSLEILFKNLADVLSSTFAFYVCGFAFVFGTDWSGFIGTTEFTLIGLTTVSENADIGYVFFFFQAMFAAACSTIVSGAVAERARALGYALFCFFLIILIYSPLAHWVWGGGWLTAGGENSFMGGAFDFAGSGVVHMVGGCAGLAGTVVLGFRNQYSTDHVTRPPRFKRVGGVWTTHDFPVNSEALVTLGVFMLWVGWLGFNGGSILRLTGEKGPEILGLTLINTTGGPCFAALSSLLASYYISLRASRRQQEAILSAADTLEDDPSADDPGEDGLADKKRGSFGSLFRRRKKPQQQPSPQDAASARTELQSTKKKKARFGTIKGDSKKSPLQRKQRENLVSSMSSGSVSLGDALNGVLAGLVSITAPCSVVEPWLALIICFGAGFVYRLVSSLMLRLRIDDPLDAFAIHGACGFYGLLCAGLFASPARISDLFGDDSTIGSGGLLRVGGSGHILLANMVFALIACVYSFCASAAFFFLLKTIDHRRIPKRPLFVVIGSDDEEIVAFGRVGSGDGLGALPEFVLPAPIGNAVRLKQRNNDEFTDTEGILRLADDDLDIELADNAAIAGEAGEDMEDEYEYEYEEEEDDDSTGAGNARSERKEEGDDDDDGDEADGDQRPSKPQTQLAKNLFSAGSQAEESASDDDDVSNNSIALKPTRAKAEGKRKKKTKSKKK